MAARIAVFVFEAPERREAMMAVDVICFVWV